MAKFSSDRFPPGFFDLPPGAGETLPLDVIAEWTSSAQTREVARAILAPHALRGIVVSTDSAGLTRLTHSLALIEILALVSHPKEIIYGHGTAVGGRSVGVWAADNTLMFYGADVPAPHVASMLLTASERIARECELGIGMAAHVGEFFELGGGVHGPDADRVENLAETHSEAGDLLVTDDLARLLPAGDGFATAAKAGLPSEFGEVFRLTAGPALPNLDTSNTNYPAPYSNDFSSGLARYVRTRRDSAMPARPYDERAVVCIVREPEDVDVPEVAVLNDLALTAAVKRIGGELLGDSGGAEVKNAGRVGFYTFNDCQGALTFARGYRDSLAGQGIQCRIGIDIGLVLLFDLGGGAHDIAGMPVNVASKLAEDVGEYGMIQMSEAAAKQAHTPRARPTRAFDISGVHLRAYDV